MYGKSIITINHNILIILIVIVVAQISFHTWVRGDSFSFANIMHF